jgi:phospholipid/cholesterol/gamma-HCH transport system ATP-binding protein
VGEQPVIDVENLVTHYGETQVLDGVTFDVRRGEIFVVLGGSGCGKSTLLRHLIGLHAATSGRIVVDGMDVTGAGESEMLALRRNIGMLFQGGALFSSMTLGDNIALPLREHTGLDEPTIRSLVSIKLGMVNLAGFEGYFPAELSGGMRKRAGLARAMALDPSILFFDEPSSGLDPVNSAELDELILRINATLGTTIVVVTHELSSILAIAQRAMMLQDGKALAVGAIEEIKERGGALARRFFERRVRKAPANDLGALESLIEKDAPTVP